MAVFNIYHVFAPFVKLHGGRFLHFFSIIWCQERSGLSDYRTFQPRGGGGRGWGGQKKHKKKHDILAFKPLLQEIWLKKTWLAERFSEALRSKLWNKRRYMLPKLTKMEQNWIIFTPYGFMKDLRQIHQRDSHMKFTGKNKVGNTTWAKLHAWLVKNSKTVFSKLTQKIYLSVSSEKASRQASTWPLVVISQIFRYFLAF